MAGVLLAISQWGVGVPCCQMAPEALPAVGRGSLTPWTDTGPGSTPGHVEDALEGTQQTLPLWLFQNVPGVESCPLQPGPVLLPTG